MTDDRRRLSVVGRWSLVVICLLFALALWLLAYRLPFAHTLHIGGDVTTYRRDDDAQFLVGFNDSEPASATDYRFWTLPPGYTYRWTKANAAVRLPGVGDGRFVVSLLAQSGRPEQSARVEWQPGGAPPVTLELPPGDARRYYLLADSAGSGDLVLQLRATPYTPPGDARELGFVLRQLRVAAIGPLSPSWLQIGLLALCLLAVGLVAAQQVELRGRWVVVGICAVAIAYILAYHRLALTVFTPALTVLVVSSSLLALALGRAAPAVRLYVTLILIAFVLRMGGMLHPQALFSDARFNANNLLQVGLGEVFLTAGLPAEAGGGRAPYPPSLYLSLLPLQLGLPTDLEGRVFLVQFGTAALDSLIVGMIGWLMLRAGYGRRAAFFAAACYLLPPPLLQSFSIGEYANIGGQALAMGFVALLCLYPIAGQGNSLWRLYGVVGLALGLLAHSGVTLSLGALVASAWGLALGGSFFGGGTARTRLKFLTIVSSLALALVIVCYYSAPLFLTGFTMRGESTAQGRDVWHIINETVLSILGLARPQGRAPLPLLLGPLALSGLMLLWLRGNSKREQLVWVLGAWWLGMVLTQGLLLVASQGVRWPIFLYPALCLGAGPLFAAIERRGRAGEFVARTALAAIIVYGLIVWVVQIRDYYHV